MRRTYSEVCAFPDGEHLTEPAGVVICVVAAAVTVSGGAPADEVVSVCEQSANGLRVGYRWAFAS